MIEDLYQVLFSLKEHRYLFPAKFNYLLISGPDAQVFLNSQVTSHVFDLKDNQFHISTVLDKSAKIICYFWLHKINANVFHLYVYPQWLSLLQERLEKFHISEDLEILPQKKFMEVFCNLQDYDQPQGLFCGLPAQFSSQGSIQAKKFENDFLKTLVLLSGNMPIEVQNFKPGEKIINETPLFDLAVSLKKGCYLGQETVSKIHSRRGAYKKDSALVLSNELDLPEFKTQVIPFKNYFLFPTPLVRELRVEGMEVEFPLKTELKAQVIELPYFSWSLEKWKSFLYHKSLELFQEAQDLNDPKTLMALEILDDLIQKFPDFDDAYEMKAAIFSKENRYQEAIEVLKKLEKINPDLVMVHTNLSVNYMKIGEIQLAEDHKAQATVKTFESFGRQADEKREKERKENEAREDRQRKRSIYLQVLEIDEKDDIANLGLAEIYAEEKNWQQCLRHATIAGESNPNLSMSYYFRAYAKKELLQNRDEVSALVQAGVKKAASQGEAKNAKLLQDFLNLLNTHSF